MVPLVHPEDFYRTAHARLYEVIRSLFDRGEPADPLVVLRECERLGILEEIGGREFLASPRRRRWRRRRTPSTTRASCARSRSHGA